MNLKSSPLYYVKEYRNNTFYYQYEFKDINVLFQTLDHRIQEDRKYKLNDTHYEFGEYNDLPLANSSSTIFHSNSPYYVLDTDYFIGCDPSLGSISINLMTNPSIGKTLHIKDIVGYAATYPIIIYGNGNSIDGASSIIIDNNNQNMTLLFGGNGRWNIL